jgi:hypothetical protein
MAFAGETIDLNAISFDGWTPKGAVETFKGKQLYDPIDGFADVHMGYNFVQAQRRSYRKGNFTVEVFAFQFDTAENAYGLYSTIREGQGTPADVPDEAAAGPGTAYLWRGPYYVSFVASGQPQPEAKDLLAMLKAVSAKLTGKHERPELVRALPADAVAPESIRFLHYRARLDEFFDVGPKNVLLLGTDLEKPYTADCVYAEAKAGNEPLPLVAIRYQKADDAPTARNLFFDSMKDNADQAIGGPPWVDVRHLNGKHTVIFQRENVLIFTLPASDIKAAHDLITRIATNLKLLK